MTIHKCRTADAAAMAVLCSRRLSSSPITATHVVIFLPLQLEGVALTRNCTFWVVREKNESEQDFKKAWDDFRAANFDEVRFCFR
jgi:hypothetical protein